MVKQFSEKVHGTEPQLGGELAVTPMDFVVDLKKQSIFKLEGTIYLELLHHKRHD